MKIILIVKLLIIALMLSLLNAAWAKPVDEHTMCLLNFDKDSLVIEGGKLTSVKDLSGNGNDGLYWFRFAFSHLRVLEELVTGYW
ncbi:hypothetical protein FJZ31_42375 [Candidatus Poribacteria bacterium]|nr:hypothetical protein [Candidatus Poribacteria bacterium]